MLHKLKISEKDRAEFTPEELAALPEVEYTKEQLATIDRQAQSLVNTLNRNVLNEPQSKT